MRQAKIGSIAAALMVAGALGLASAARATLVEVGEVGDASFSATDVNGYFDEVSNSEIFNSTTVAHASVSSNNDATTDVDWYSFTGVAGATVFLDVDCGGSCGLTSFDATLSLFDPNATLIAWGDDSAEDPGTSSDLDSFVGAIILPSTGTYHVAVSNYPRNPSGIGGVCSLPSTLTRPDGSTTGGYATSGCTPGDDTFSRDR